MTAPRMTPTNDAPVTVEQIRQSITKQLAHDPFYDRVILPREQWGTLLAALAAAPAADGVDAATRMMRDCADDLVSTASHHGQYAAIDQDKIDGLRDAVRDYDAALDRPRAAVGDWRSVPIDPTPAMIQAGLKVDHEHLSKHGQASPLTPVWYAMISAAPTAAPAGDGERNSALRQAAQEAYRVCAETRHITLGDKVRDAILALQSPPAKEAE